MNTRIESRSVSKYPGLLATGILTVATILSPGLKASSVNPTVEPQPAIMPAKLQLKKDK